MASVRVAVRVRPLNKREKELSSKVITRVKDNTTSLLHTKLSSIQGDGQNDGAKTFSYDFSYDSTDKNSPDFTSQEMIFQDLGLDVLHAAFQGFNACVFAYGQTGSGKSYTMMGDAGDKGLIPRICEGLFCEIAARNESDARSFRTEVGYLEIYNERVLDLLNKRPSSAPKGGLRVREHPTDGPYVENLSRHVVHDFGDVKELMASGNANRTTASTGMNDASSRSHAMFTINFTQAQFDSVLPCETQSKIHLVDLAGSERADATQATGTRLKEGASINKSLVTLGSVISALADISDKGATKKQTFIPYRDSVLTWLLKDSLGGNSKTIMIATVSPADVNYGETLSTLRYASRAKHIVNSPTVNEDASVKVIRELQEEIARLRGLLVQGEREVPLLNFPASVVEERLHQSETKVLELTKEWTHKWWETENILKEETLALRKEGSGVVLESQLPHLIGIDKDLLSTGILIYHLKEGRTLVGSDAASGPQDIVLQGPARRGELFVFENRGGAVSLIPHGGDASCLVNGAEVTRPCQLTQGAVIQLGPAAIFRFNHPTEAAQLRRERQNGQLSSLSLSMADLSESSENLAQLMLLHPSCGQGALSFSGFEKQRWAVRSCMHCNVLFIAVIAILEKRPVPRSTSGVAGAPPLGGAGAREGHEQQGDPSHKSGPCTVSAPPRLSAEGETGPGVRSCGGGEPRSGGVRLRQTSVPGSGDGCGGAPVGDANESQGVVADFCRGHPGSGGSSLGSAERRLRRAGETGRGSDPPHTASRSPPLSENAHLRPAPLALEARLGSGEMDAEGGIREEGEPEPEAATVQEQRSRLGSLVSRVSWMFPDPGRLLRRLPGVPGGRERRWSTQVVSLIRRSQVLNAVKTSQMFSLITESYAFSLVRDSHAFSVVNGFPLVHRLQLELSTPPLSEEMEPNPMGPNPEAEPLRRRSSSAQEDSGLSSVVELESKRLEMANTQSEEGKWTVSKELASPTPHSCKSHGAVVTVDEEPPTAVEQSAIVPLESLEDTATAPSTEGAQTVRQNLLQFPDVFKELQSMPLPELVTYVRPLIPDAVLSPQTTVGLYWLEAATPTQPRPRPALVLLLEAGLYALTWDAGSLAVFHHFPLRLLQEVHMGLAGQSLHLMGGTLASQETWSVEALCLHTRSRRLTQEVCRALLGVLRPGDGRASRHPLLHRDLASMSLDWHARFPDLLLDAGLKVTCQFQKTLADLVYLLHANMPPESPSVAEVRVLLYTSVRARTSPRARTEPLACLLLTETHLALVQEEPVFRPGPPRAAHWKPHRSQFLDLALRSRADVRCLLLHDAAGRASTAVDVILACAGAEGRPGSGATLAVQLPEASKSPSHAEVWKLTFSCTAEAACLINHLSTV
ncbi:unnamed protein product [Lota lota]